MILIVSALFPPEPVVSANLSFDIANNLAKEEKVVVISPSPTRPYGMNFKENDTVKSHTFEHIILNSYTCPESKLLGRMRESYSLGIATKKYIEMNHENIDVIYANTWPLFAQRYLAEVAHKYKIPFIIHVHDIYPESIAEKLPMLKQLINRIFLPIDKNILKHATKVVTVSNKMKTYLIESRSLKKEKVEVVRNWQNDSMFVEFYNKNKDIKREGLFTFMYLGSINPTASVDLLIHSFGKSNLVNSQLIIAGSGPDKERCIKIAENYKEKNIIFNEVFGDEVPLMQAKADVFLLPLKKGIGKTALPSKLTAYLFSSKPVIASIDLESEAADIIRDNSCGIVVEPENEQELIKSMKNISQMGSEELLMMGKKGFIYAQEHLSRESNLSKIVLIIKELKRDSNA